MLKFSTYEELLENEGLKKKAAKSGISLGTLKKVYNRGMAAWRTGHRPGTTPQQWGMARVNSYITKGKGTYYGADSDLSGKGKKKDKKEGYVSYAQQKAAHASMAEKGKKRKNEADDYHYATGERVKKKEKKNEAMDLDQMMRMKYQAAASQKKNQKKTDDKEKKSMGAKADMDMRARGTLPKRESTTNDFMNSINEISKKLAKNYIGKASRDVFHKGQNEALDKKDTATVKKVIKGLKGAVKAHSGQVKTLTKDIKDDVNVHNDLMNSINEISKSLAKNYIGKASRDVFDKGRADATQDAIGKLGGKHKDQDYQKGPERKASMRVRGIDRATNRLMKKEADDYHYATGERIKKKPVKKEAMSDAEKAAHQKAIDAFKAKGGKVKKLKPGYAQGYHGKPDPAAGMKGMMDKGDTKFMPKKKVRSMK